MPAPVIRRDVVPFVGIFALLIGAAILGDFLLHRLGLVWIGRYLGIPGIVLILASQIYSLRKRKVITAGHPGTLLRWHEFMAWLGSMLVLIHAGIHFNALLPWLAVIGMLINVASGLVGKFLLQRARRRLVAVKAGLQQGGTSDAEIERAVYWDAIAVDVLARWRTVHLPIAILFASLAAGHLLSIFMFWGWR
jgi:hypothetical protein